MWGRGEVEVRRGEAEEGWERRGSEKGSSTCGFKRERGGREKGLREGRCG